MTEQELHIIELYLRDQLGQEEKHAFEQKIKSDADLRSIVSQMRAAILVIRESAIDDKLALLKGEEEKHASSSHSSFRITPLYLRVAIAAVLLIGLFFLTPLFKPDDTIRNPYLAENFEDFVLHETTRGNNLGSRVTPEQERAYNLYRMQKFHKAMPYLEKLWNEERDTLALFYLGVSKIAIDKNNLHNSIYNSVLSESRYQLMFEKIK